MTNFSTGFSNAVIMAVGNKGLIDSRYNSGTYRYDRCGAWIKFNDYGNRDSEFGWEIDHIIPVSRGGTDHINNLQPLHYKNNVAKGDGPLQCAVGSGRVC